MTIYLYYKCVKRNHQLYICYVYPKKKMKYFSSRYTYMYYRIKFFYVKAPLVVTETAFSEYLENDLP